MDARTLWHRILVIVGGIAMAVGTVDPVDWSLFVLAGSGLILLGLLTGRRDRRAVMYSVWVFALIAVGVAAMIVLSLVGGIGGDSGHSIWWGLLVLPYPAGWLMAVVGAIFVLVRYLRSRNRTTRA
ncbi:MAG: hypothetical protein V4479_06060 [Actinomycetota bacterium]